LALDRIAKKDIAATEASLLEQLEIQSHTAREAPSSAADEHRRDFHLDLVDKPGFEGLCG